MASQISKITTDLKTQALTPATIVPVSHTLYTGWLAAGMTFTPSTSQTVAVVLNRHFDPAMQSLDVALAATEIDRNQQGIRVVTDQVGGG